MPATFFLYFADNNSYRQPFFSNDFISICYMQLVTPKVVASAVNTAIAICSKVFQVSFFMMIIY